MGDTLHQTAIAEKRIGVVVNNVVTGLIKLRGEDFFRQCHANSIGNALAQWPGRGLDTWRFAQFGVTRCFRMHLAEVF